LNGASGIRELGPFVEAINLKAWLLHEMVLRLGPSAVMYANQFPTADKNLERISRNLERSSFSDSNRIARRRPRHRLNGNWVQLEAATRPSGRLGRQAARQ
jgi:hypothetical protein